MKLMTTMMLMTMMIIMIITVMSMLMSTKMNLDHKKMSPYECGFNPNQSSRTPFSLQFFLIAILFIIFDIEITLIFPMIIKLKISNPINLTVLFMMFMIILMIGLYHEWNHGALNWLT